MERKMITIDTHSLTATYDGQELYPGTDYGDAVPVLIRIDAGDAVPTERIIDTATIKIGEHIFCLSEIEHWVALAKQAKQIAKTFK